MILPCRIHRTCNRHGADSLPLTLLLAACLLAPLGEIMGQEAVTAASEAAGLGWLPAVPLQITVGLDMGYDDHVNGGTSTTSSSGQSSLFATENIVLTYARPSQHTQISLVGVGSFTQYVDIGTDDKMGNVTLSLTHNFSTRLSFYASVYATYATEPDFKSDVGPENVRAPHFDTADIFSVTYQWLPRLSTITSYTFHNVKYADSSIGGSQDRIDGTIGETLKFSLTSRTNLLGDYRFEKTDYDTAPMNSTTHSILVGIDHHLTEHLVFSVLGGNSFRSQENTGDSTSPTFESSLAYARSNHSLTWTASYGFEAPNVAGVNSRQTFRTGVVLGYNLTSRLSSTTGVYYHHDENQGSGSSGSSSTGPQDSLDLLLGLTYTVNNRFALHANYSHTSQSSLGATSGYSQNRCSAGLTYTY
jgi:hypothetical protein